MFSISRLTALLAAALSCAAMAPAIAAQTATPRADSSSALDPLVGSELRVHTDRRLVEGRLLLVLPADTMLMQTQRSDTLTQVPVPLGCVRTMEELAGHYGTKQSALRGGLIGLVIGAGVGGALRIIAGNRGNELGSITHVGNGTAAVGVIALVSGGVGALIGSRRGVDRWTSVPVPRLTTGGGAGGGSCESAGF